MQRAFVVGYLQEDPKTVPGREGAPDSLRLRVRCRNTRYSRDGEVQHSDTWVTVAVYGRAVDTLRSSLHSGDVVAVTGRATFNRFRGRDGQQRADFSIVADEVERLEIGGGRGNGGRGGDRDVRESRAPRDSRDSRGQRGHYGPGGDSFADDDIPW